MTFESNDETHVKDVKAGTIGEQWVSNKKTCVSIVGRSQGTKGIFLLQIIDEPKIHHKWEGD